MPQPFGSSLSMLLLLQIYHVSSMGWRDWNDGCQSVWWWRPQSRPRPRKQKRHVLKLWMLDSW